MYKASNAYFNLIICLLKQVLIDRKLGNISAYIL